MPWLGFLKRDPAKPARAKPAGTSSAASSSSTAALDDFASDLEAGTDEQPTVRMLRPEEVEKLQSENAQLKAMIQALAERAAKQQAGAAPGATTGAYPNLAPSAPPSAAAAASSSPSEYSFQKVPDLPFLLSHLRAQPDPSAPLEEAGELPAHGQPSGASGSRRASQGGVAIPPEELKPVADFYEALRQSLAASHTTAASTTKPSASATSASATAAAPTTVSSDSDDEWGLSSPSKPSSASVSAADSVRGPRSEDEAIVHSKQAAVVIHKKPLRPVLEDADADAAAATASRPPADEFDEFGMESETTGQPAGMLTAEEPEEEIAIFDVSQADWWFVVPHPDRANEELVAAPQPPIDPAEDEDGFVLIKSKDSVAALGEFISSMMAQHPDISRLSPEQVRCMIEQSLVDRGIKEPTTTGKLWKWGANLYSIWSWTNWGLALYKDQTTVRMVAAGIIKAATWTCVFLV